MFNGNAIVALLALSLLIPLSAGVFDLSIAYNATLTCVVLTKLIVAGVPLWLAIVAAIFTGLLVGLGNACVVVLMRVDSFIGTLATGSLVSALVTLVTGNLVIESPKLSGTFLQIGQATVLGFTLPVFYVVVVGGINLVRPGGDGHRTSPLRHRLQCPNRSPRGGADRPAAFRRLAGVRLLRRCGGDSAGVLHRVRRSDRWAALPVARVRGRVPRCDSVPRRPIQRAGDFDRDSSPWYRGRRAGTGCGASMVTGHVHRSCVDRGSRIDGGSEAGIGSRPLGRQRPPRGRGLVGGGDGCTRGTGVNIDPRYVMKGATGPAGSYQEVTTWRREHQ